VLFFINLNKDLHSGKRQGKIGMQTARSLCHDRKFGFEINPPNVLRGQMFQIFCDADRHRIVVSRRAVLVRFPGISTGLSFIESSESGFSFGLTPVFLDNDMRFLILFEGYLTRRLDRPVALVKRRSQRETIEMLLSGQLP
jgi:hypothetical protein